MTLATFCSALIGQVEGHHLGPAPLHLEAEEAARGADLEHADPGDRLTAEVTVDAAAKVPLALDQPELGQLHGVVEVALGRIVDVTRGGEGTRRRR